MEKWPQIDASLWNDLKNGDKQAYATVYRMYYGRLFNYGSKFTKNNSLVEDCIQETLTTFWMNRRRMEAVENFDSYLFISFRNQIIKGLQQHHLKANILSAEDYEFEMELSVDQIMINAERLYEQHINLKTALQQLTQRQKEAIYFKYYENMSYNQIAGILNISTKATYKLVARAICELRLVYQQKISSFLLSFTILLLSNSF
jgi:RNA polymerase sigma factor (sigma-70 family)